MKDIFLILHLSILAFTAWNMWKADRLGFMWMKGKIDLLDEVVVRKYHMRVWTGLVGMMATGFLMFWPMREYLLARPQFYAKIAFVLILLVNGFVIGRLQNISTTKTFKELRKKEKAELLISGAISAIGWLGAAMLAFFIIEDF